MDHSNSDDVVDSKIEPVTQMFKVPAALTLTKRMTTVAASVFNEPTPPLEKPRKSLDRHHNVGKNDTDTGDNKTDEGKSKLGVVEPDIEMVEDKEGAGEGKAGETEIGDNKIMESETGEIYAKDTAYNKTVNDNLTGEGNDTVTHQDNNIEENIRINNGVNQSSSKTSVRSSVKSSSSARPGGRALDSQHSGLEYVEPPWGGGSDEMYCLETVKNGVVVDRYDLSTRSYHVFGRLPSCDHSMDHPSLSRYHAVIQHCSTPASSPHRDVGWYLYDLDSTHGTWLNKQRVKPHVYNRLRVGYVVKFGGSSRIYIVQGPAEDQDQESELSVTQLKEQRERQKRETEILRHIEQDEQPDRQADTGCMWGMAEDAVEDVGDVPDATNPFSLPENESLYLDDPKKALRGFYEREGLDLPEYHADDDERGTHKCRVEVPIDTSTGQPLVIEVHGVAGKKKDAVVACALEACRTLDRMGLLRQAVHESRAARKKRHQQSDDDDDDDEYLDRTGEVKRKRESRLLRASKAPSETYETLSERLSEAKREREEVEARLERDKEARLGGGRETEGEDELDRFMNAIKSGSTLDVKTRTSCKQRLVVLKQLIIHLERLVNLAKPSLPQLSIQPTTMARPEAQPDIKSEPAIKPPAVLPTVGKMKCAIKPHRPVAAVPREREVSREEREEFIEEEEEEESMEDVGYAAYCPGKQQQQDNDNARNVTETKYEPSTADVCTTKPKQKPEVEQRAESKTMTLVDELKPKPSISDASLPLPSSGGSSEQRAKRQSEVVTQGDKEWDRKKVAEEGRVKSKKVQDHSMAADPSLFDTWLPPTNQIGDGKTDLNNKYGY